MRALDPDMDRLRAMVREVAEVVGMKRLAYESGVCRRTIERWMSGAYRPLPLHRRVISVAIRDVVERMPDHPWEACRMLVRQVSHRA